MLYYFIKNRHGIVTIFWSIILVVVLSFSSLLLEIGKKRSIDALFKQATENATFSMLGNYDKDLYKRFGLLAMNPNVDAKTFENYVNYNLNRNLKDSGITATRMEAPVAVNSVEIEKMYDLSDTDVLRNQIEEVVKYRAPLNQINQTFELETKLKDFFKEKLKEYPMISFLMSMADIGQALCDVVQKYEEMNDASQAYITADDNYKNEIDTYNNAVSDYKSTIANLNKSDPDYGTKKSNAESAMSAAATNMNKCIDDLIKSVTILKGKAKALQNAIDTFIAKGAGAGIQAKVELERKKVAAGEGDYQIWTKEEVDKYDGYLKQISDANAATNTDNFIASFQGLCDDLLGLPFDNYCQKLNNQKTEVSSYKKITKIEFQKTLLEKVWTAIVLVQAVLDVIQQLRIIVQKIQQAIDLLDDLFKAQDIISTVCTGANLNLNDNINGVISTLPSYQKDAGFMDPRKSYMDTVESDRAIVQKQIDDTSKVANDLGYSLDTVSPRIDYTQSDYEVASHKLAQAKEQFRDSQRMFKGACIPVVGTLILIMALVSWVVSFVNLIKCMWDYIVAFKNGFTWDKFISNIYSNMVVSSYAVYMFPNRTTDTLTVNEKDLLRNPFSDSSAYWSSSNYGAALAINSDNFSVCRAEYIYGGKTDEISNQRVVYSEIEKWRILNNIFLLAIDDFFQEVNKALLEVPVLGWIVALLIDILVVMLETDLDMVLLCCANAKFNVIKTDMWLWSGDGLTELCTHLTNMINTNAAKESVQAYFDSVTKPVDPVIETSAEPAPDDNNPLNDIFKWGYEDYLQFMITFENNDYVVSRIADLIQLEMNARYQAGGKGNYDINQSYTYLKVSAIGKYKPILPMPSIPLANSTIYKLEENYYCGY